MSGCATHGNAMDELLYNLREGSKAAAEPKANGSSFRYELNKNGERCGIPCRREKTPCPVKKIPCESQRTSLPRRHREFASKPLKRQRQSMPI
jgi:hypothetical protein